MEKKFYLTLSDEFIEFCRINDIDDVLKTANDVFNRGFTILKYGDVPSIKVDKTPSNSPQRQEIIGKRENEEVKNKEKEIIITKKSDLYAQ